MLVHGQSEPSKPSRVIILGAGGFVSPALAEGLGAGRTNVIAISSSSVDLREAASVGRLSAIFQPGDTVVMTAALTPEKGRDTATLINNLRMAEHVAAAMRARPFSHLIYFSSDAVYDGQSLPISEATPAAPVDLYGIMHRARELELKEASEKAGVPFCVLRPCAIYGPGDTHNSYGPNRFVRTALKDGKIQIFGLGEETRDHVYIGDVVSLTAKVAAHRSSGTLNLVSGQTVSFGDLASQIAQMTGGTAAIESLPRKGAVTHRPFDAAALRGSFPGHTPTRLAAGLRITIGAVSRG
jgi:UDP-glucose 4-epimerase